MKIYKELSCTILQTKNIAIKCIKAALISAENLISNTESCLHREVNITHIDMDGNAQLVTPDYFTMVDNGVPSVVYDFNGVSYTNALSNLPVEEVIEILSAIENKC